MEVAMQPAPARQHRRQVLARARAPSQPLERVRGCNVPGR
jgi:hypothetical protein